MIIEINSFDPQTVPAKISLCPPKYLVALCIIKSIPEVLTNFLPEGIEITGMVKMQGKYVSLQQSVTSTTWDIEVQENKQLVDAWAEEILSSDQLVIERTRKGKKVIDDIKITPVNTADEVLKIALTKELKPTDWVEVDKISENKKTEKTQASIQ